MSLKIFEIILQTQFGTKYFLLVFQLLRLIIEDFSITERFLYDGL
jgi:hypothetical protein